ncbi:MAG TPA: hypothetical protein DER68_03935 [Ruminococcaceae bacterium]|nr:hypothetical protein [Oscillospiraceae bacterium]
MAKKKVKTCDEFIREALGFIHGDDEEAKLSKDDWNDQVSERYSQNRNLYSYRINDFTSSELVGRNGNYFQLVNSMNRFDGIIENMSDPVQKSMGIAVRHFIFPEFEKCIKDGQIQEIKACMSELRENFEIPPEVNREFRALVKASDRNIGGDMKKVMTDKCVNLHYGDIPQEDRLNTLNVLMSTFSDKNIFTGFDGKKRVNQTQPMTDILEIVNKNAEEILKIAKGEKSDVFKKATPDEERDLASIKDIYKKMSPAEKEAFENSVKGFTKIENYANMDITPNVTAASLVFDKNPIVDLTAESFVEKQKKNELSPTETEWGETTIDRMVKAIYTDDELKTLEKAGIDPAMGILVDGKAVNWAPDNSEPTTDFKFNKIKKNADIKCGIAAKAMEGAKLDVCKFVPDGHGGFINGPITPVKTDISMNTETRSLWTILKQLFGFVVTLKDKVKVANEAQRDYQIDPANANTVSAARRAAEVTQIRNALARYNADMSELDLNFFSGAYNTSSYDKNRLEKINEGIQNDLQYTDFEGNPRRILKSLNRNVSRANLAIMYGMSKGYSYEEMTDKSTDGINLRSRIGKEFVSEIKVMTYDEFANSSNVEKNDVTREAYNRYLLDRVQNIEKVCASSYDVLSKLPIPRLDPSNHRDFGDSFIKQYALGKMAMDFSQSYEPLKENKIAPTNAEAQRATERAGDVYSYTAGRIKPFTSLQYCLEYYLMYMSSDMYLSEKTDGLTADNLDGMFAYSAGKAKGMLSYYYDNSEDIRTIGDYLDNKKLGYEVSALSLTNEQAPANLSDNTVKGFAEYYLPSANHDFSLVMINDDTHTMLNNGVAERYYSIYNDVKNEMRELETALDKYEDALSDKEKELPFLEKYNAIARKTSINAIEREETVKEKISFNDLFENNTSSALAKKPEAAEKPMTMSGMKM